jgi:hypothetical protein
MEENFKQKRREIKVQIISALVSSWTANPDVRHYVFGDRVKRITELKKTAEIAEEILERFYDVEKEN